MEESGRGQSIECKEAERRGDMFGQKDLTPAAEHADPEGISGQEKEKYEETSKIICRFISSVVSIFDFLA